MSVKNIDVEKIFNEVATENVPYDVIFKNFLVKLGEVLKDEVHKELQDIKHESYNHSKDE